MKKGKFWDNKEIEILNKYYETENKDIIENLLPERNWQSIQIKAQRLGLHRLNYFSDKDLIFIMNNYSVMSCSKIGKILNRSKKTIQNKVIELGIKKQEKWSCEEIELLKNYINNFSVDHIAKNFLRNRTNSSIYHMIQTLHLQNETARYASLSNGDIVEKMKNICYKLGRTITLKELTNFDMPSPTIIAKRFGSYSNFCNICNLSINTGYIKSKIFMDKRGEKCLSNAEKLISDFLFDNNFFYKKEVQYKEIIPCCKSKIRCDWLINNKIIVEFFGMERHKKYKEKMNKKIEICKNNNVTLVAIYEKDLISDSYKNKLFPFIK